MPNATITSRLFYALWAAALCGSSISYGRLYAFHILLIINVLWLFWTRIFDFFGREQRQFSGTRIERIRHGLTRIFAFFARRQRQFFGTRIERIGHGFTRIFEFCCRRQRHTTADHQPTNPQYLTIFWLILPLWFLVEMTYCADKMAALQHFVILSFGASLVILTVLNLKTTQHFKRIAQITTTVALLNCAIGIVETLGLWRFPISSLSRTNEAFGYKSVFWEEVAGAFHGSLVQPSASLNYNATLHGAFERIGSIPTAMFWNPNNFSLFLLILLPFCWFSKQKMIFWVGTPIISLFFVLTGARLVFLAAIFGGFLFVFFLFFQIYSIGESRAVVWRCRLQQKKMIFALFIPLFIATNGFSVAGKYFWQSDEMAFFYKKNRATKVATEVVTPKPSATTSINVRKALLHEGIATLKNNYGIGIGGGNMEVLLQKKGGIGERKITVLHNFWLELAVEGGIFAAILFAAWYFLLLKTLFLQYKNAENIENTKNIGITFVLPTIFALLMFPLAGIAPSGLLYFLPMYALFGWAIALCGIYYKETNIPHF